MSNFDENNEMMNLYDPDDYYKVYRMLDDEDESWYLLSRKAVKRASARYGAIIFTLGFAANYLLSQL